MITIKAVVSGEGCQSLTFRLLPNINKKLFVPFLIYTNVSSTPHLSTSNYNNSSSLSRNLPFSRYDKHNSRIKYPLLPCSFFHQ